MRVSGDVHTDLALPFFYRSDGSGECCTLTPDESRHVVKALRLKVGDSVCVTDGKGKVYRGMLTAVSPQRCVVEVLHTISLPEKGYAVHITIAPTKNTSRMEWLVEKAVEIGVDQFSFIRCRNSERKMINIERLKKKAISALKQSKQARLPAFHAMTSFTDVLTAQSVKFIAHIGSPLSPPLWHMAKPGGDYTILIGPEGGFTTDELDAAKKAGCQPVSLSQNRLRTETAGIVACQAFNFINQ